MENSGDGDERKTIMGHISEALLELRDALTELSLSLKDWQFEVDFERRRDAETTVQNLLREITSIHGPAS